MGSTVKAVREKRASNMGASLCSVGLFEGVLSLRLDGGGGSNVVLIEVHELGEIELGLLEELDLADHAVVLEREDLAALLLDLLANIVLDQDLDEVLQAGRLDSLLHDLHHLFTDQHLVGSLGVASGLDLLLSLLGEGDAEHTEDVAIEGLSLDEGLDEGVPLLDHGATVISGDVHAVEVGVAVKVLDFLDLESELSPGDGISGVVAVTERKLEDSASEVVRRVDETGRLVDGRESNASLLETGGEHVVPLLPGERMNGLLDLGLFLEVFGILTASH
jgi:hypothetical protein